MEKFNVSGMSCAACVGHVEKAVSSVDGVSEVNVNLLTNSMTVEGGDASKIISAVQKAGYGASIQSNNAKANETDAELTDKQTPLMLRRLILSVIFLLPLLYLSMGHMMFSWPLPSFLEGNHVGMAISQMLLCIIIIVINKKFFISGIRGLINRSPNMDTLIALGSGVSFGYSIVILYMMTYYQFLQMTSEASELMNQLYFESAAMILTLITIGKTLESYSKGRTTDAIKSLISLTPDKATVLRDDKELVVNASEVVSGDIFIVRSGDKIPVDGVIISGITSIDESALTGESIPNDKSTGDEVSQGTINVSGFIKCRASRVGSDTTLAKIIQLVKDASAAKAPIARVADKISAIFVPIVLLIALATAIIWLLSGAPLFMALKNAISVLVISCPCALGLATPVAIMVGNGLGARNSILFKSASSLEQAARCKIVAFDKTGTITKGTPYVTDVIPLEGYSTKDLLKIALSLEIKSLHPLALSIVNYATDMQLEALETTDYKTMSGLGVSAVISDHTYYAVKEDYANELLSGNKTLNDYIDISKINSLKGEGKTIVCILKDNELCGLIALADIIKDDAYDAIAALKKMGIYTLMLTGDNQRCADYIASCANIDLAISNVLPGEKEALIRQLSNYGDVIMVGDGINDAPALTSASVGIAIGTGTKIAIESAEVIIPGTSLMDVAAAIKLSKATLRNIYQNLFWAFIYNIIGIPLAAGLYYPLFGITLSPGFAAAAMSLSSFCVVMNALRLNLFNIHSPDKFSHSCDINIDADKLSHIKGDNKMTQTLNIKGMMCPHCEMNVKKALEAIDGVTVTEVSHEKGIATVSGDVSADALKEAVTGAGYEVV